MNKGISTNSKAYAIEVQKISASKGVQKQTIEYVPFTGNPALDFVRASNR